MTHDASGHETVDVVRAPPVDLGGAAAMIQAHRGAPASRERLVDDAYAELLAEVTRAVGRALGDRL